MIRIFTRWTSFPLLGHFFSLTIIPDSSPPTLQQIGHSGNPLVSGVLFTMVLTSRDSGVGRLRVIAYGYQ